MNDFDKDDAVNHAANARTMFIGQDFSPAFPDNNYDLGTAALPWTDVNITGAVNIVSDARFKENVTPIASGLETINKLNPVKYNLKRTPEKKTFGLIAQEVMKAIPEQSEYLVKQTKDLVCEKKIYETKEIKPSEDVIAKRPYPSHPVEGYTEEQIKELVEKYIKSVDTASLKEDEIKDLRNKEKGRLLRELSFNKQYISNNSYVKIDTGKTEKCYNKIASKPHPELADEDPKNAEWYAKVQKKVEDNFLSLDYVSLIPLLIKSVQELSAENKSIKERLAKLEA